MFEIFKKKFKELKWYVKKHKHPSLFDLNYTSTEDPSGKPFATPERIIEYIELGADIHEHRYDKKELMTITPFYLAYKNENYKAIECLFKNGGAANINDEWLDLLIQSPQNKSIKKELLAFRKRRMKDALLKLDYHTATKDDIDRLIERGAEVNACVPTRDSNGLLEKEKTAIFLAIEAGNYEAFHQLVTRGANLTVRCGTSFPSEVAKRYAHSRFGTADSSKIDDWFRKNKEFVDAIEKARIPSHLDWDPDKSKPLSMRLNDTCLGTTPAMTQNYVTERRIYRFGDYEKKGKQKMVKKNPKHQAPISLTNSLVKETIDR